MKTYSRAPHWRDLRAGLLASALILLGVLYVLTRVGVGRLPGEKFTIYAETDQARGILRGSDVWLAGKPVGSITDIEFREPGAAPDDRILLKLAVLEEHRHLIRRDSRGRIRRGTRLLANPVLYLSLGSPAAPIIETGDTIATLQQIDAELVASRAEAALKAIPELVDEFRNIRSNASSIHTQLTGYLALTAGANVQSPLQRMLTGIEAVSNRMTTGSLALITADTAFGGSIASLRSTTDSLRRLYVLDSSVAARFVRDSGLVRSIDSMMVRFTNAMQLVRERVSDLTTGARADALRVELDRLAASMRALRADARRHPFRYIVF